MSDPHHEKYVSFLQDISALCKKHSATLSKLVTEGCETKARRATFADAVIHLQIIDDKEAPPVFLGPVHMPELTR